MAELVAYGNVTIPRMYCRSCKVRTLVVNGRKVCCDQPTGSKVTKWKRASDTAKKRARPKGAVADAILAEQGNVCLYCDKEFGGRVWYHGKMRFIEIAWDHMVPWSYSQNNRAENFAASCQFCNGWKSNRMFSTLEEAREYSARKWAAEDEGAEDVQVRGVRRDEADASD